MCSYFFYICLLNKILTWLFYYFDAKNSKKIGLDPNRRNMFHKNLYQRRRETRASIEDSHEFSNLIPGVESCDPTPAGNRSYPQNRLALPTMP